MAQLVGAASARAPEPAGYGLTGAGVHVGVWDDGHARDSHVDLRGRVRVRDLGGQSDHATHTTATLAGNGSGEPDARGLAGAARVWAYDWHLDLVEIEAAAAGLSVSSNAYGPTVGWSRVPACPDRPMWWGGQGARQDPAFGRYSADAAGVDALVRRTDLLLVWPAGNERLDRGVPAGEPHYHAGSCETLFEDEHLQETTLQFTTLAGPAVAKNALTVGAARDVPHAALEPERIVPLDVSGFGPTADGRIKPDLLAGGDAVRSAAAASDVAYATLAGSSSATAATAGAVALLTELYRRTHAGADPRAAELKALLVHAAREAGAAPGPDYGAGYGLLDVQAAADLIAAEAELAARARRLVVAAVTADAPIVFTTAQDVPEDAPLRVTLAFSDLPGTTDAAAADGAGLLVNDLDVVVVGEDGATRFHPWVLDPNAPEQPATRDAPNRADTLERVDVEAGDHGGGRLRIEVSAARGLWRGRPQPFALVSSAPLVLGAQPALSLPRYVVIEAAAGEAIAPLSVRAQNRGGGELGLRARSLDPWIAVTPAQSAAPAELVLELDPAVLDAAHEVLGRVLIESDDPAGPRVLGVIARRACEPDCSARVCGQDPVCGEPCGRCALGESCEQGRCAELAGRCPHADLGSELGASIASGEQRDATGVDSASCGGTSARDFGFAWRAPAAGRYAFTTRGSTHDTLLYLRAGGCGGAELACSDDAGGVTSALALELDAGESVTAVVDAFDPASLGRFELNVARAQCPAAELGSRVGQAVVQASTAGGVDLLQGACGGEGAPDVSFGWTAPATGRYRFALFDPRFQSVLYVRAGGCDGAELGCSVAADIGPVEVELEAGERVVIGVDGREGRSGGFTLDVVAVGGGCAGACGGAGAGECFCDAGCVGAGDCCFDACEACGHCRCQPSCAGNECGGDGCGGTCGDCGPGYACEGGGCAIDVCEGVRCDACSQCVEGECRALAEGSACEDGDPCSVLDRCRDGVCSAQPRACDDGLACTRDRCDVQTGACVFSADGACGDGGVTALPDAGDAGVAGAREGDGGCGCSAAGGGRGGLARLGAGLLLGVALSCRRLRRGPSRRTARR